MRMWSSSRGTSRTGTCTEDSSKATSQDASRKVSIKSDATTTTFGDDSTSFLVLKGLPQSEALLSHRQFRANSRDEAVQEVLQLPMSQAGFGTVVSTSSALPCIKPPAALPPPGVKGGLPSKRKVKKALDTMTIVTDAIAKLWGHQEHINMDSSTSGNVSPCLC